MMMFCCINVHSDPQTHTQKTLNEHFDPVIFVEKGKEHTQLLYFVIYNMHIYLYMCTSVCF